jgi:hypothetical protein
MKATYRVLAMLIPVIVVLQASFIALGVFGLGSWVEDGNDFTKSVLEDGGSSGDVGFALHSYGAMAAALVAVLLLVVSFFAKVDGGVRLAAFVFLAVLLQWVLAFAAFAAWAIGILHGLNAFLLAALGSMAAAAAARSGEDGARTTTASTDATSSSRV